MAHSLTTGSAGLLLALLWPGLQAQAQDTAASPAFKLTVGVYEASGGGQPTSRSTDLNLRHSSELGNIWVGHYVASTEQLQQDRVGWDRSYHVGQLRLLPSVQLATGGAWNGSLNLETGDTWYGGAGLGRTNGRQAVNLNFDPNDAWSVSGGHRWRDGTALGLVYVRDNRDNPDQQHLHLVWRQPLPAHHRLTVDLLLKRGLVEGQRIERAGLSVAYDWPRWFVRLSYDPKVNFTTQDMWRLAGGTRF